jgi:hypothetical protein
MNNRALSQRINNKNKSSACRKGLRPLLTAAVRRRRSGAAAGEIYRAAALEKLVRFGGIKKVINYASLCCPLFRLTCAFVCVKRIPYICVYAHAALLFDSLALYNLNVFEFVYLWRCLVLFWKFSKVPRQINADKSLLRSSNGRSANWLFAYHHARGGWRELHREAHTFPNYFTLKIFMIYLHCRIIPPTKRQN